MNQSTSYILLVPLSGAEDWVSFSSEGSYYSILSSSMDSPSLIILWILVANDEGSYKENPDARRAVSNNSQIKSLTVYHFCPDQTSF